MFLLNKIFYNISVAIRVFLASTKEYQITQRVCMFGLSEFHLNDSLKDVDPSHLHHP